MSAKTSVKVDDETIGFLKKFSTNRRKIEVDERDLSYWRLIAVIVKYFKNNNDRYMELVKLAEGKNA